MLNLVSFVWNGVPGPKYRVIAMSIIVGLANGAMLSAINGAISARTDGTFDWTYPALFLASVLVFFVGGYFAMYRATEMAQRFTQTLRETTIRKVQGSALRNIERYGRGEIYTHITRDSWTLGGIWTKLVTAFQAMLVVSFCLVYLVWLSPVVFALTAVAIAVGIWVYFLQEKFAKSHLVEARRHEVRLFGGVGDMLDGFKELKLSQPMAEGLIRELDWNNDQARRHFVRAEFLFYATSIISKAMLFLLLGVIAFVPAEYIGTRPAQTFQTLALLLYLVPQLEQMVNIVSPMMQAEVAKQRLDSLDTALAREDVGRIEGVGFGEGLRLKGVELDYTDPELGTTFTLGPIDFAARPGEIVFLVGGNGSGKTTLMKVLAGLYPPDRGEVSLGDTVLDRRSIGSWRDQIASVFHDFHLFDKAFGHDPERDFDHIRDEIARVGLADKVTLNEDGSFSTVRLSTGQRKRLALVLARAQKKPLLLLDEFGAEQDPEFRAFFYTDYLDALRAEGITVIAVSHDDRYFGTCDRLVKLDLGRIVHDGPPDVGADGLSLRPAREA